MYFKALELIGFKSFAEKTRLNFEPGVTAIVGPNGCGKSNCADAIRWVLGEQSAKSLRAGNMQDVIFNGTDNKEPINFAEVSLTFSNEKRILPIDYDEVTITRRIFRSGDTEYLLNKTPVRLKDISELLMGTGIGTESYSIIEQGKMDLILSSKPEDRRYVFEEASGITKFKSKKKEALRKLEQTEQNLLRINDIILEVKRQIGSIERQAKKAERYKADFDRLKEIEMKLSFREFKELKTQEKTYSLESQDAKAREAEGAAAMKAMAEGITGYRVSLEELGQKISDLKSRYSEIIQTIEMNNQKISMDKERIEETHALEADIRKELSGLAEKMQGLKDLIGKLKNELDTADSRRSLKAAAISQKEARLNELAREIGETEARVKTCKVRTVDHLAKETRIKNELIKLGADVQTHRARERRLALESQTVESEKAAAEDMLKKVLEEFDGIAKKISQDKAALESERASAADLRLEIKALGEKMASSDGSRAVIKSKVEILEESVKRREGFGQAVRHILAGAESGVLNGIRGVVADLIKVKRGHEIAVTALLGDEAQVIITDTDADIARAIAHLKSNALGSATFLSLETLGRLNRKEPCPPPGTPLKDFVNIENGLEAVADYFFRNAYLTESGYICNNGKISGGSSSEADEEMTLIGRRDRLADLKTALLESDRQIAAFKSARDEKDRSAAAFESKIAFLEESIHGEEVKLANVNTRKEAQEANAVKLAEETTLLASELEEVTGAIKDMTKSGTALNIELNNLEKEKAETHLFIDQSHGLITARQAENQKTALELATMRAEIGSLEKELQGVSENLKAQEAVLFEFEETSYSRGAVLKESAEKVATLEAEMSRLQAENEAKSKVAGSITEELVLVERSRASAAEKLRSHEAQSKTKEAELERLRNQIRDIDVKLTEINYKKTNLKDRILQSYKTDIEGEHMELEEGIDWDAISGQVAELKERLDKMGPVNLAAMDEHKELEERYAFLVHQQEDLTNAKDSLMKAIQKINKTTKELFIDTFQKIQVEFKNFFRLLFGGGQAELVLIDEQDVLESGIEIIVRPPGKKLQNIMLLSGGEKALTAIALLFSIFKVKPSPFCVLDEIDAPLDESNVNRFSNVLKDFLKISQFIIITHNKRTIELADVMYGITMQERGVSKIVSVKFLDSQKKAAGAATKPQEPVTQ